MSETVGFKKIKRKQLRARTDSPGNSDNDEELMAVQDMKEMQKLRKRAHGVSAEALGATVTKKEDVKEEHDPFKLKTGGYVDMKNLNKGKITMEDLEHIGTSFAAETNRRDEDADMLKYVDQEMKKRKGIIDEETQQKKGKNADDFLYELPEHIKELVAKKKRSEDMLSNQMLSGIPEVDLGIHAKIKNIEATEEAKSRLLEERKSKKVAGLQAFVPTNMAVNFVQHNRFTIEENHPAPKKEEAPKPVPVRVGDVHTAGADGPGNRPVQQKSEKATDDFHYEKFKKQLRRY